MKVGIVGHFGFGHDFANGQTVKTKNLSSGLKKYTETELTEIDTYGWSKHPFRLFLSIRKAFKQCDTVIMLPAHNGIKVFAPLLTFFKRIYKKKTVYDVVGGWLPEFLSDKPRIVKSLKEFDGIWVETETMKKKLIEMGFRNVTVVPNFKELTPLSEAELVYPEAAPYKLCTFSRVMKQKGIETAVNVIKEVNEKVGFTAFTIDIYGPVAEDEREWFDRLLKNMPDFAAYKGCAESSKSVDILKDYFALLFPTHFYTEGIPGTIIDAYAAGIPVISARWESFSDVIEDGVTGIGYEFDNIKEFEEILLGVLRDKNEIFDKKKACLEKSKYYMTESAVENIMKLL